MTKVNWSNIESFRELESIEVESATRFQLIFKYSNRCGLSHSVFNHINEALFEKDFPNVDFHFLDIISFREVSDAIESKYKIRHESPQVLIIKNGDCVYSNSHTRITFETLKSMLSNKDSIDINTALNV